MNTNTNFRFTFKPVVESQQEMIHKWLQQDYIKEWIHGQGLQNTLTGLTKFIQLYKETQAIDRHSPITQHWIGYEEDKPLVYLLTSNTLKDEESDYSKHRETEGLAITLDIFICDKEYLGKGLATQIIREFLLSQFSDVTEVFIDPEQTNKKAVHVYQKAGFKIIDEYIAPWHPVPHYMMKLNLKEQILGSKRV